MDPLKNKKTALKLAWFAVIMLFFCYALVPLYNVLCRSLGINGKTGNAVVSVPQTVDMSREVTLQLVATNNEQLPWKFYPDVNSLTLHPGEQRNFTFFAENETDHEMTVQAIPSVSPSEAAQYLKKTQCFCFTRQTLGPHQKRHMPVVFHIDPKVPQNITSITLSYTLFDVKRIGRVQPQRAGHIS